MTPHMPTGTTTRRILRMALARGGLTINPYTGEEPDEGYSVSAHSDREERWHYSQVSPSILHGYFRHNVDLLGNGSGSYFGVWRDGDLLYLDVLLVVPSLPLALVLAKEHNTQAIYDLKNREVIWVKGEGDAS